MSTHKLNKIKFLFISYSDLYGGASIAGYRLHQALLSSGYISTMVVKRKFSNDNTVIELNGFVRKLYNDCILGLINFPFSYRFGIWLRNCYDYFYKFLQRSGREIFFYPESKKILKKLPYKPDVIHLHDIHGDYFDISVIKKWSKETKLFITLHDLWLFTGHCALPLDCERFKIGCGNCPDLELPPKVPKDKTRENYSFKEKIIKEVPINFIAPSNWVFNQLTDLQLNSNSTIEVIPNTLDTNYFIRGDKKNLRSDLGLPLDGIILLTCSVGFKNNPYKDLGTLLKAFNVMIEENELTTKKILLVIIGEKQRNYDIYNKNNIIFVNQIYNQEVLLNYYQSADLYIHSSNIETWGLTISEALSTGLPVIASAVGGIPEQVKGYNYGSKDRLNKFNLKEANGILFERKNVDSLYKAMKWAINNKKAVDSLARNARSFAIDKLDLHNRLPDYLNCYSQTEFY